MAVTRASLLIAALAVSGLASSAIAAENSKAPPAPPEATTADPTAASSAEKTPDTWIFSGVLQGTGESFSGTLVAKGKDADFELKLGGGATCDGSQLDGDVGMVRLPEITCSDDRTMRALFVPQSGNVLKVFGHVGDDRFASEAHLLGTEALPEPKQTAQPKGPLGLPPLPPGQAPK